MRYHIHSNFVHFIYYAIFIKVANYVTMSSYAFLLGTRVGEAGHPGPSEYQIPQENSDEIKVAVVNPTAIFNKLDDILNIGASCYCLAETSATNAIQKTVSYEARQKGFSPFWGSPVQSRQYIEYDKPTYRGDSIGTCCLTNLPSRRCPISFSLDLVESCRVNSCIVRMGALDVLVVCVYGLTGASPDHKRANDYLLASIHEHISSCRLPAIIGGDFNVRPETLQSWSLFKNMGYVDAFDFYRSKWGCELPPTCNNKTRNDTLLIPTCLQKEIVSIEVLQECHFDKHAPLLVTFRVLRERPHVMKWKMPLSWKNLQIPSVLVQGQYDKMVFKHDFETQIQDESLDFDELIHRWSKICENSVDQALKEHHQIDPLNQHYKGLPQKYKGRCCPRHRIKKQMQNPVTYANDGSYNPSALAFTNMAKQKVKQVRRIQSLYQSMQNHFSRSHDFPQYDQYLQWRSEWDRIQQAHGYGKTWCHWILGFENIVAVPWNLPSVDFLLTVLQITKHDCEHTCVQEQSLRCQAYKQTLHFDRTENYLRNTYKICKDKPHPPVSSVEATTETDVVLIRSKKDRIQLRIVGEQVVFSQERELRLGSSILELVQQKENVVTVKHASGYVPTKGRLKQTWYAMTPCEVDKAFHDFWSPFWNRDKVSALESDDEWHDILEILDGLGEQDDIMEIKPDDPEIWYKTIHKLKPNKSTGYDGWTAEDLQILPYSAVQHLCQISQKLWKKGFSVPFMQARTVLLAKIECVQHMGHCRPITILGQLYRLTTKIIADQILSKWAYTMPSNISGGLPGRGSRLLMYAHQANIETAISSQSCLGGFVLDLVKAFNCIPRRPLAHMMVKKGIPIKIVKFWMSSLQNLSRLSQVGDNLGTPLFSTTGVPEGDAMSVCGMICLASCYHDYVNMNLDDITVNIYADNWGWATPRPYVNFHALRLTMQFVTSIRMIIDFMKSWAWAVGRNFKQSLDSLHLLFPDGLTEINIVEDAKELGVCVKYNKKIRLGTIKEKFQKAQKTIAKIHWIPTTGEVKAKLIRAVWQKVLYGQEGLGIGMSHFNKLRRAATNAILGYHKMASSWIACSFLQRQLQDPQLFAIVEAVCILRQMFDYDPGIANSILERVYHHLDRPPKQAWGPASTLAVYFSRCGISMNAQKYLIGTKGQSIQIDISSCKDLKNFLTECWCGHILEQSRGRKGIQEHYSLHRNIALSALEHFDDKDKHGLYLNITGGFQSGKTKNMCQNQADDKCRFCGEMDTKQHRLLHCKHFTELRRQHKRAVEILSGCRQDWVWIPVAYEHNMVALHSIITKNRTQIGLTDISQWDIPREIPLRFFTDGSCIHSNDVQARRAGFSIILDTSVSDEQRLLEISNFSRTGCIPGSFKVVTTAHVSGPQNAARGELSAFVITLKTLEEFGFLHHQHDLYTDASYVVGISKKWQYDRVENKKHKTQNFDLIHDVMRLHNPEKHRVHKVKAHQKIHSHDNLSETWMKLGNFVADEAAKASLKNEDPGVVQLSSDIASHNTKEKNNLLCVYKYMVAYNQISQREQTTSEVLQSDPYSELGNDNSQTGRVQNFMSYKTILENWTVPSAVPPLTNDMTLEIAQCCSWGSKIAYHVYSWVQTLRWPDNMDLRQHDHGITFLELLVNFHLVTGADIPVTISRKGSVVHWVDFRSPKAIILPKRARSASAQGVILAAIVQQLEQAMVMKMFPIPKKIGIKTLSHLGHYDLQKRTGFIRRPQLLHPKMTIEVVDKYLTECRNQNNFNLPLLMDKYVLEMPRPINCDLPSPLVDIQPGAVPYHRKKLKKLQVQREG